MDLKLIPSPFVISAQLQGDSIETDHKPMPRTGHPKRDRSKNRAQKVARRKNRGK